MMSEAKPISVPVFNDICFSGTTLIHGESFRTWMKKRRKKLNGNFYFFYILQTMTHNATPDNEEG